MKTFIKKSVKSLCIVLGAGAIAAGLSVSPKASAQEAFLGEIRMVGFNFPPRGYANCDGQLLSISTNTALFALYGTMYGGDGRTTFALPDLRGRSAIHPGSGPGLSTISQGQKGGAETVTLTQNQMPSHTHDATSESIELSSARLGNSTSPSGRIMATTNSTQIYTDPVPHYAMASGSIVTVTTNSNAGDGQSHENRPPFLGIYHVCALVGVFPSRN
jgi:microcystin-dependent protein